jgi:hypothetical protein
MTDIAYQIERMEERAIQLKNQVRRRALIVFAEKISRGIKEIRRGNPNKKGDLRREV